MTRTLHSRHAEDVGGVIVEPGQPIPDDADADVVNRLQERGLVADDKPATKRSSASSSSKGE
jgi:hypothetical protein